MKKIILVLFVFALTIAFTACSNGGGKNTDLTNNPSAAEIKTAISTISDISIIEIATEDRDPNGQLGKQGGYTGSVFFKSPLVDESELFIEEDEDINSAIDCGTNGGGNIEIYATASDANKRNDYLASFDGTVLSSGSHKVIGTIVIRISSKLTATEQQSLETAITEALSK